MVQSAECRVKSAEYRVIGGSCLLSHLIKHIMADTNPNDR